MCIVSIPLKLAQKVKSELLKYGKNSDIYAEFANSINVSPESQLEIKKESHQAVFLFGFYMDKLENRIGNTGWDFIKGDIGFKFEKA